MTVSQPIRLFVSSSPDLAPEREALGQAVAELPISAGWEIKHTPRPGEDVHESLAFIDRCDLYVVVLGADFAAPMGLEWQEAHRSAERGDGESRPRGTGISLAYRKRVLHSPSAQQLLRQSGVSWTAFESPQSLKAQVTRALARMLLDRGERFGLHLGDVEGLLALVEAEGAETPTGPDQRQGAGRGGVILERGT